MRRAGFLCAVALLIGSVGQLQATLYNVDIDTSALTGSAGAIAFDFTSSTPNSNTVQILNFFHDGTAGLPATLGGLISGDIILGRNPAPVTRIEDSSFFNSLVLPFESFGSRISFAIQITENAALPSEVPDEFSFFVLGPDGLPLVQTLDPLGSDALFTICVDGSAQGLLGVFDPAMLSNPDTLGITLPCLPDRLVSAKVITDTITLVACKVLTVIDTEILSGNVTFLAGEGVVLGGEIKVGFTGLAAESTDVPVPIPDLSTVMSTIDVVGSLSITDVTVTLDIEHTSDVDLTITLIGPGGTRVELSSFNGGSGDNYTNTTFDDDAALAINLGSAPFFGSFRPEQPLSAFDGGSATGTWTLEITDSFGSNSGTLLSWTLGLNGGGGQLSIVIDPSLIP